MILERLAKRQDEWLRMAHKVSPQPFDALQDAYLKMYDRFKDKPKDLIDMQPQQEAMYMYLTLRSVSVSEIRREKKYTDLDNAPKAQQPYDLEEDKSFERRVCALEEKIEDWHWYDQKLFNLHIVEGMSMRKISRETGISVSSIFKTIKSCKKRLRE